MMALKALVLLSVSMYYLVAVIEVFIIGQVLQGWTRK